jgi:chromate reductase, NAD(P)H dehydrogenase (quinone)
MTQKKNILVISGSASLHSSNEKLIEKIRQLTEKYFYFQVYNDLKKLPHFDPDLSIHNTPDLVLDIRENIQNADGIIICTPEYIYSIPSGLKNVLEWCVSTTVFSDKPIGLITASANGQKGHEELQLIMKTLMTKFTEETTILIQGIKGKVDQHGEITDNKTNEDLLKFIEAYKLLVIRG